MRRRQHNTIRRVITHFITHVACCVVICAVLDFRRRKHGTARTVKEVDTARRGMGYASVRVGTDRYE